jgi:hypothetical protein
VITIISIFPPLMNRFFIWSILRTTLNKVLFKVSQIQEKLNNVKNNSQYSMQDGELRLYAEEFR